MLYIPFLDITTEKMRRIPLIIFLVECTLNGSGLFVHRFSIFFNQISPEIIQKYKHQDFANKLLFLYEIIEKQLPSTY